jgi:hypothetical protein
MNWSPTDAQLRRLAERLIRLSKVASRILHVAAILAALVVALEIGMAFLPGGAVSRVLGGH